MTYHRLLDRIYRRAKRIGLDKNTKIVLMSDCHRSDGGGADDFLKNQNLFLYALTQYEQQGFIYIELGDGDELWKNKHFSDISRTYHNVMETLRELYIDDRFYMLYGNHDMVKRNPKWDEKHLSGYFASDRKVYYPYLEDIEVLEGVVLQDALSGHEILLVHGHQEDPFNYTFWRLSRFLVRYVWRPLEMIGVKDPSSAQINHKKKNKIERRLTDWAKNENKILIAGHTHRAVFPEVGEGLYFNDGSCVHANGITAIEIIHGQIALVEWSVGFQQNGALTIKRNVLEGPVALNAYFAAES